MISSDSRALAVDLDGTLCRSDTLWECLVNRLKSNPADLLPLIAALHRGRREMKLALTPERWLNPVSLPWSPEVLEFVQQEKAKARTLVLASASPQTWVETVGAHFPHFDLTLGTTSERDLKRERKGSELVERFGEKGFDYVGNSPDDIPVWQFAAQVYTANPSPLFQRRITSLFPGAIHLVPPRSSWVSWLRLLRPHQWTKNLLLVLPLLTAHVWQEPGVWNKALLAIVAISLCASAVYIWNDLSDLEGDRVSPTKKNRPLAAGEASLPGAFFAGVMLLFAGGLIGTQVNAAFFNVLVVYTATALSYAVFLKRVLALDVILLAGLYTLRMYAGAAAVSVSVSLWLFAFSTFVFLSLGLAKRCAELLEKPGQMLPGRAYGPDDLSLLQAMGVASAFSSMVILALYVSSADVARLYFKPQPLWGLCLLHGFWMLRLWLLTQRGKVGADPVWWAVKDRGTYAVAFGAAVLMWCAGPR